MSKKQHIFAVATATLLAVASMPVSGQVGSYRGGVDRLSGSFELDRARSDNPQSVADEASRSLPPGQRDRVYQNLTARMEAPDRLTIDVQGRTVTVASSSAPRMSFAADGRDRTETGPNGRAMTIRADLRGNELTVSTTGNRGSNFTVRFEPVAGGLQMTRQLDSDTLDASITARSFYRRVGAARWDMYNGTTGRSNYRGRGGFVAPGTVVTARLDRDVSRSSREGDRFTMNVVGPVQYRGAILEGHVIRTQGMNMVFDFDRVRLASGQTQPFEGVIQSVRLPNGESVRISNEGTVRDQGGIDETNLAHAGVGAALGAIVGAIAGGGKGAAIGAVAGGAGTLVFEGQVGNNSSLPAGTELIIRSVNR